MTYWQIASGDKTRDYSEVCLSFGVVCIGSGNPGEITENTIPHYKKIEEWDKIKPIIEVKEGDRIVLKSGRSLIQAVGEVVKYNDSVYNYSNCFKDVDGWDLQHYVKVKWKNLSINFNSSTELHRSTMARLHKENVISEIEKLWESAEYISDKHLIPENTSTNQIKYSELEENLIDYGVRISDAENTSRTIGQVEKLATWYLKNKIQSTEHEIRTFLVIPFLQALGWPPQKIGIEVPINRKKLDIVLYGDNARKLPKILVETKKMWEGSAEAIIQSKNYLNNNPELNQVNTFVVTDGLRYWLYEKNSDQKWIPSAYMNFQFKMKNYAAYPDCEGIFGFIKKLIG